MTRIKICGITNLDDARAAAALGADALGFVFASSPRRVTPTEAVDICRHLPDRLAVVGVFVSESPEEIARIGRICSLDFYQVHGAITPAHRKALGSRLIPAVTVHDVDPFETARSYHCSTVLLDAPHAIRTGSPIAPFDWRLAQRAAAELNVILAGGLNSGNVVPAVELVRPYAVDVSGGVETRPGRKDYEKLASFIKRIREWDSRTNAGITVSSADGLFLKR